MGRKLIPAELRHRNIFFFGDLQNREDLNESIKPLCDYVIIKNATKELLGDTYGKFVDIIDKKRKQYLLYLSHGEYTEFERAPQFLKHRIDRFMPRVQELPPHRAYILYPNWEWKLITVHGPSWHHKQEGESLTSLTGITWKLKREEEKKIAQDRQEEVVETKEKLDRLRKQDAYMVLKWCIKEHISEKKSWKDVLEELRRRVESADPKEHLPATGIENLTHVTLSNRINLYPELKAALKFAKSHKDLPMKDRLSPLNL